MSWVCSYCSTVNAEENSNCIVCGRERSAEEVSEREVAEGKVVFSEWAVIRESCKNFARNTSTFFSKIKRSIKRSRSSSEDKRPRERRAKRDRKSGEKRYKLFHIGSKYAKPWPEHRIKFEIEVIKKKGFVRFQRAEMDGIKGYLFFAANGTSQFIKEEKLIIWRMAKRV